MKSSATLVALGVSISALAVGTGAAASTPELAPAPGQVCRPTGESDLYETFVDTTLRVRAPGVTSNDTTCGRKASWAVPPSHGVLKFHKNGSFSYEPKAGWVGIDTFTYVLLDPKGEGDPDQFLVTIVVRPRTACDAEARSDTYVTPVNTPLGTDLDQGVSANDDTCVTYVNPLTDPAHGFLSLNGNGDFYYVPDPDFTGVDTFEYERVLLAGGRDGGLADTATVTINVG